MDRIRLFSKFVLKSILLFILDLIFLYFSLYCIASLLEMFGIGDYFLLVSFLFVWSLYYLVLFRRTGQTLAMKIFKMEVRNSKGDKPDFFIALSWMVFMTNPATAIGLCLYVINIAEYKIRGEEDRRTDLC